MYRAHFEGNTAANNWGAIYSSNSNIIFSGCPNISFNNNRANILSGATGLTNNAYIKIQGNCSVELSMNTETLGESMYAAANFHIIFQNNSTAKIFKNKVMITDGAIHICKDSKTLLNGNSKYYNWLQHSIRWQCYEYLS